MLADSYKSRDGRNRASGRDITFADGRKIHLEGSAPPRPELQFAVVQLNGMTCSLTATHERFCSTGCVSEYGSVMTIV